MSFRIENGVLVRYIGTDTHVVIPDGVMRIGEGAFEYCRYINGVTIPNSVEYIGARAFQCCINLTSISIPRSVTGIGEFAFWECSRLARITIPSSINRVGRNAFGRVNNLKEVYFSSLEEWLLVDGKKWESIPRINNGALYFDGKLLEHLVIPNGIRRIRDHAFEGCISLTCVSIPNTVTSIGSSAFCECTGLTDISIPESVISIDDWAFQHCRSLTYVNIPDSVTVIGHYAFKDCYSLRNVKLPNNSTSIGTRAFSGCKQFKYVDFENRIYEIDEFSFDESTTIRVSTDQLRTCEKISAGFAHCLGTTDIETCGWLLAFQTVKAWLDYLEKNVQEPGQVLIKAIDLWSNSKKKIGKSNIKQISAMAVRWGKKLDAAALEKLFLFMDENSPSTVKELRENISYELIPEETHPIEECVQAAFKARDIQPIISAVVKSGLPYADRKGTSSIEAVMLCLNEYALLFDKNSRNIQGETATVEVLRNGHKIKKSDIADKIAEALDQKELLKLLAQRARGRDYRKFILAYTRWAGEKEIEELAVEIRKMSRGKARDRYWAQNAHEAMFLSDTRAAMEHFDKSKDLDRYARKKGMSAQDLRDTLMMPEFGFDADGVKHYDIGGNTIEVSITPELQLRLFDVAKQKEIRSIPKKSADPEKVQACAEDFAAFKKEIQKFVKDRTVLLRKLHVTGEKISGKLWHEVYCEHSVLRHMTPLLVWQDDNNASFILINGEIKNCDMQTYAPVGDIRVAHVMNMIDAAVTKWQQILVENGVKQLFAQMWEPVINWTVAGLPKRYEGVVLSKQERSALKKALEQRGVEVKAEEMEKEWNHRMGVYEFSNSGALLFGNSLRVKYDVDPDNGETTFEKAEFLDGKNAVELNAIIFELDCAAVRAHIKADRDTSLYPEVLDRFTAAQICEFVNLAIDSKATRCTALLMDYKNKYYPEYADVDEFSLDW